MVDNYKKHGIFILVLFLLFCNVFIFYLDWQYSQRKMIFAMLDIGQGDALFIESPDGTQILVDAGPPKSILRVLPKVMPFWDRSIDAIIITNPDADHIGGFADILKMYKVGAVFEPGTFNSSVTYKNLEKDFKDKNIPDILIKNGMKLDIGGGAFIEVLFPDRDVSGMERNDGSVVVRLVYGETSILLTGDATQKTEKMILNQNTNRVLESDILKVGHHGSHTSTSKEFVEIVAPRYAFISDGKNNKYGHPHKETLETLSSLGVKIFRTDLLGTILVKSDGQNETFSFIK